MKKILLLFIVLFCTFFQISAQSQNSERKNVNTISADILSIYPNPTTDFITLTSDENVKNIELYSLLGRKIRSFDVERSGERYDVSDLPNGVYFLNVLGKSGNKPLLTLRLTKKS